MTTELTTTSIPQGHIGRNLPPDELLSIYMTLHDDTIRAVNRECRETCNDLMWFDFGRATVVCGIETMLDALYAFCEKYHLLTEFDWSDDIP